jgi:hypothetical protein
MTADIVKCARKGEIFSQTVKHFQNNKGELHSPR